MDFNTLIKEQLFPLLEEYDFGITEEFEGILHFQSSVMKINVVFNSYDKSHLVEIGKRGKTLYLLND